MMRKMIVINLVLLAIAIFLIVTGINYLSRLQDLEQQQRQQQAVLPSIEEIQLRIGANPDGKLGSQTQEKWERALNDQSATQYFKSRGEK